MTTRVDLRTATFANSMHLLVDSGFYESRTTAVQVSMKPVPVYFTVESVEQRSHAVTRSAFR